MRFEARLAVINVPSKVGHANWERCFRIAMDQAPVFGINETFLKDCKQLYAQIARANNLGIAGLAKSPNPIFWDRAKSKRMASAVHQLHARGTSLLARRYPGYNDARYVTELVLKDRMSGQEYVYLCSHWVVGPGRKLPAVWQAWARAEARKGVRKLMVKHNKLGRPVFFMGDTNVRRKMQPLTKNFFWIKNESIDKVGVSLPKGWKHRDTSWRNFAAPTDHHDGGVTAWTVLENVRNWA